jgi:hypothetical protein
MNARSDRLEPSAADSNPLQVPIGDVLSRAGHELVHLVLENLQSHICPLIQEAAGRDANILHQMQSFDRIGQIATGLTDFLAALALEAPRRWVVDPSAAARSVTLADLSSRLGFTSEEGNSCSTAWGDCDLTTDRSELHRSWLPEFACGNSSKKVCTFLRSRSNTTRLSRFQQGGPCRDRPFVPAASHLRRRRNLVAPCPA